MFSVIKMYPVVRRAGQFGIFVLVYRQSRSLTSLGVYDKELVNALMTFPFVIRVEAEILNNLSLNIVYCSCFFLSTAVHFRSKRLGTLEDGLHLHHVSVHDYQNPKTLYCKSLAFSKN